MVAAAEVGDGGGVRQATRHLKQRDLVHEVRLRGIELVWIIGQTQMD